jgi:PAS domain S-box-containing protein
MTKILIIDDEKIIRDRLKNILVLDGYDAAVAEDGVRGLELFSQDVPDVVLVDIKMPKMDGIEVLKRIKALSPDTEVILITGHGSVETAIEAMKIGAFGYVQKPVEYDELAIEIQKALEKRQMKRQIAQYVKKLEKMVKEWELTFNSVRDMITVHDNEFRILKANKAFCDTYGGDQESFKGRYCYEVIHKTDGPIGECVHLRSIETKQPCTIERCEPALGAYLELSASPIFDCNDKLTGSIHVIRDITARKRAEQQIQSSLKEKEVLLKEVHHRVKNNLQVVSSLLYLQSVSLGKTKNPQDALRESCNRIRSMALIHEKLYKSEDVSTIDFAEYLRTLVNDLFYSFGIDGGRITIAYDLDAVSMGIDTAIPCGLIVNEAVSNALKYAYPANGPKEGRGEVRITLRAMEGGDCRLTVADDGVGLPDGIDPRNTESLGLRLITTLVDQLEGSFEFGRGGGTEFSMVFKQKNKTDGRTEDGE